ncbi:MAG: cell wall-active antibiotics response protein [Paludibacter sp.]|nr:cell wall-active antibiotics response protein [Paludibacter sp.]
MENEVKNSFRSGYTKGLGFGLVLMLIGVIFLGFNFGLIPIELKSVIISWQMLLIFIGVVHLFKRRMISGVVLIFVGGFFIIPKVIHGIDGNFVHVYWPLLLIGAGIVILLQRVLGPKYFSESWNNEWNNHHRYHHQHRSYGSKHRNWESNPDGFSKNSVFGSGDHIVLDPEFKGGELNAVFGGLTLDLRRTNLPVGETRLEINAVFGGITVFVPADWLVETHLDSVFGGFQDNRMPKEPIDTTKKLIVSGSCVFGGGELRN